MITNNSLKEYYINIQKLYNNAVNILSALNQSLSTSASEITVSIADENDAVDTVRIPSFLYLESKLEQLTTNFSNLFEMPKSGEAWFNNTGNMYKLELVKNSVAPVKPQIDTTSAYASITDNNILKDMVSPKTYIRLNVDNLPNNISQMFMRKIVFLRDDVYTAIAALNLTSYEEYSAALFNLTKGVDYEEYDSTLNLPIKQNTYYSEFSITDIPNTTENPWTVQTDNGLKIHYKIKLNTLQYHNQDDSSITHYLKAGDYICLQNNVTVYKIIEVNSTENIVEIEEYIGHVSLQTTDENSSMILEWYDADNINNKYSYVDVPLEENKYICVFLGTIYNNVRSILSEPYLIDLTTILMYDAYGSPILDINGNQYNYISYYKTFCTNIGDLILGLTQAAYPQISNFTVSQLDMLQNGVAIQAIVTNSINGDDILKVVPINKHLVDDVTTEELLTLHNSKNNVHSQLYTIQANIDTIYNTLITTDFSKDTTVTQMSLQEQLQTYYNERTGLQKELISLVSEINSKSTSTPAGSSAAKYRIRGITNTEALNDYIHDELIGDSKLEIVGCDIEYKYKSTLTDTTTLTNINSSIFTDWNKQQNIDRERYVEYNTTSNTFELKFVDYSSTQNIIKWNQIDIPINQGEDVVIRVRYKLNIGQPFINLYTPWSDEITMEFPSEYNENIEVYSIIDTNSQDAISAKFTNTLINEGYQDHITNSIQVNNQKFYHMPENIYSGFNTAENNMLSLKDKLNSMVADIEKYKEMLDNEYDKQYTVYLQYDEENTELLSNTTNSINIYNTSHISDTFIKKDMNIVIKNTGTVTLKLYSIFPGNTDIPLLLSDDMFTAQYIQHYERVPIIVNNELTTQTLGQCIYFRQNNPFTLEDVYYNDTTQSATDKQIAVNNNGEYLTFNSSAGNYMNESYKQVLLGYRKRYGSDDEIVNNFWHGIDYNDGKIDIQTPIVEEHESIWEKYRNLPISFFMYRVDDYSNNYLMRYEDITTQINNIPYHLDSETSISEFLAQYIVNGFNNTDDLNGAFLFPNLLSKTLINTTGKETSYVEILPNESLSIPICFEYYKTDNKKVTKSLYFDIRPSLLLNPHHYMIDITANTDTSVYGDMVSNIDRLYDDSLKLSEY